tara:strand:+ start:1124 stop:2458 length:1335 start_codon:yes stop_codon:yes gene_type:complete
MENEFIKPLNFYNQNGLSSIANSDKKEILKKHDDINIIKSNHKLRIGLYGWYSVCTTSELKDGELFFFSMYDEPLILYRDKNKIAKCVKDLCPHRGASFYGGEIVDGELVCPYHGARFSAKGRCTNLNKITCRHIVDSNYEDYAKKIHLYQYNCIERDNHIYIYYGGKAVTSLEYLQSSERLSNIELDTYGFNLNDYEFEEVIVDFKCDWARIIENHLDILHIFWVHGDTIPDKDVSKSILTSFKQQLTIEENQIESKYIYRSSINKEFITIKYLPPGRIIIYKGEPDKARYVQVLDHIPLGYNKARVIVRHYRKFLKNNLIKNLIMFKQVQRNIFYKIFDEDYMILKTQTYNHKMGFLKSDNIKLLGEDRMIQYFWNWYKVSELKDKPWLDISDAKESINVYDEMILKYPPEIKDKMRKNKRQYLYNIFIRAMIPIGLLIIIL